MALLLLFILRIFFFSFLISLPFLYDLNAKFRYYFKFFVFYFLIAATNLFLVPFACWKWKPLRVLYVSSALKLYSFITHVLNIRWKVKGESHLASSESCVIVANRQHPIGILGISTMWPYVKTNLVVRQENRDFPARLCDFVLANREDCKTSIFSSTVLKELMQGKTILWIFLERLENFKSDIFHFAVKEKIPIVPLIFSDFYFLDTRCKVFDAGDVTIEVLTPFQTINTSVDDVPILTEQIKITMQKSLQKLSQHVTPLSVNDLKQLYIR